MITRSSLGSLAIAPVLAAVLAPAAPAFASSAPTRNFGPGYTCDRLVQQTDLVWSGFDRCVTTGGALPSGPLVGLSFTMTSRETGLTLTCTPDSFGNSGTAWVPQSVTGNHCGP